MNREQLELELKSDEYVLSELKSKYTSAMMGKRKKDMVFFKGQIETVKDRMKELEDKLSLL